MLKFVLILFLFIGAPLGLKAQQDSYKYINVGNIPEYKVELRIYVGDNLKGMLKTINVD